MTVTSAMAADAAKTEARGDGDRTGGGV